jgi:hypothetical protein
LTVKASDWKRIEETLRRASGEAIGEFAAAHPAESFYGFALDCNPDYGEVLLSLNTEADLAATAARRYAGWSPREIEGRLRWGVGDWRYHAFNTEPPCAEAWDRAWSGTVDRILDAFAEAEDEEADDMEERFLVSACRVLLALEKDGAFDVLGRDPGFKTLVAGHDEPIEDSWARLLRFRNARR